MREIHSSHGLRDTHQRCKSVLYFWRLLKQCYGSPYIGWETFTPHMGWERPFGDANLFLCLFRLLKQCYGSPHAGWERITPHMGWERPMGDASLLYRSLFLDANLFSNSSEQIQIKPKVQFQFVPRDTEGSECAWFGKCRGFWGCSILSGHCLMRRTVAHVHIRA